MKNINMDQLEKISGGKLDPEKTEEFLELYLEFLKKLDSLSVEQKEELEKALKKADKKSKT